MKAQKHHVWWLGTVLITGAFAQTQIDLRTQTKSVDFSAVPVKPFQTGTTLPVICSPGQMFLKSNAPAGKNIYACTGPNLWTLQASPIDLPDPTGQDGKILTTNSAAPQWSGLAGDVSGTASALQVTGLQGRSVAPTAPEDGQILRWNGSLQQWLPGVLNPTLNAIPNYAVSFTNQSTVSVSGSAHGLGTANLVVQCYDNAQPANLIEPSAVSVDRSSYNVGITFTAAQSGKCVLNGSGGGALASINSDTTVAHTFSMGSAGNSPNWLHPGSGSHVLNLPLASASGVTAGLVSNTFYNSVITSSTPASGGDVAGTFPNLTLSTVNPLPGQCGDSTHVCQVTTDGKGRVISQSAVGISGVAGGSGGSQPGGFEASVAATSVTFGASCSPSTPCVTGVSSNPVNVMSAFTANGFSGSGTAYVWVTSAGLGVIGLNGVTISSCTNCTSQQATGFPISGVKPLHVCTINSGTPNCTDARNFLTINKPITGSGGTSVTETANAINIDTSAAALATSHGVSWSNQSGGIATSALCAAGSCGSGQYSVLAYLTSTAACAVAGAAAVGITLSWTDAAGTKSAQMLPLRVNSNLSLSGTLNLGTTTDYASGQMSIWSTGTNDIQYGTTYTGCSSGTGTYALRLVAVQVQ